MPYDGAFTGYRWSYFSSLTDEALRLRAQNFIESTNWNALMEYATTVRGGRECNILPDIGLGYNHMVRIIEFDDNERWIARLRMQSLSQNRGRSETTEDIMKLEHNMILLVKENTNIPVPQVHAIELDPDCGVNAQFMLMDCLKGNVGIDLGMEVPSSHKSYVIARMAEIQVELSRIQLPKIGTILHRNDDGSFEQGPIPGIGGPFETAAEFFKAWAAKIEFGLSKDRLREVAGSLADELSSSASSFRSSVGTSAESLSVRNRGPFPLYHGDFGHSNMIFDDEYKLLGVIDWEAAFAGPWEISGEFPLTLSIVPPDMDAPWNYDEKGYPKDAGDIQKFADREAYIAVVAEKEREMGLTEGYRLSTALKDSSRQYLATAMRLYQRGMPGWYAKVMERLSKGTTC
ncbi:unnamed protein product [Penicillium egyptiacum]|uniref:Aminoglycoside phosphotransferase domain-containing protein n=1 Tax=Penicillium egyptiacum TaxID=1303716 RepID=A0A9W4KAR2_9EURO|nr:unnamed protein product [Penicillium egyptiacum]